MSMSGEDADSLYSLKETKSRRTAKFKTTATDYLLKVKNFNVDGLHKVLPLLEGVFSLMLAEMTAGMNKNDQLRFVMHSPQLSNPISLPFMAVHELTARRILFEVERVLQSYEQFALDDQIEVNLIHVEMPTGKGNRNRKHGGINLEQRLKKKRCFITIRNNDELCCARAIVTALAKVNNDPAYLTIHQGRTIQKEQALLLHYRAGVPFGPCGVTELKQFQVVLPDCQIVVVSAEHFNGIIFEGPKAPKTIYLYFHDDHYDVITSMPAFLGRAYYCLDCKKGYNTENVREHCCNNKCLCCHQANCPNDNDRTWIECAQCHRMFKGPACFENHKRAGAQGGRSICTTYIKCEECGKVLDQTDKRRKVHRCGEALCRTCQKYDDPDTHRCYMKRKKSEDEEDDEGQRKKKKKDEKQLLFFDFECEQETGEHIPNLVVAQDSEGNEHVFKGPNTCDEFCDWLFSEENEGTVCIAHNLKGYDSYFILNYLYRNKILPNLIMNGAKVMEMTVEEAGVKFIDSLNFFAMPLASLPKTFGLTELAKGYFPHFFNTRANQEYVGPLPDVKFYDPDGMKPEARTKFLAWHQEQREKGVVFDLQTDLLKYCRSDVDILRRCCLDFRKIVRDLCDIDPFEQCITIASLCNTIFRTMFLKEDTIAIIPHLGYRPRVKQSMVAYRWLAYVAWLGKIDIRHGRGYGEKRVGRYFLDGFCEASRTVYEFHGCYWHGCPRCFPADTLNPTRGLTMHELYERTITKAKFLVSQGFAVVEMWECDFNALLEKDEVAKQFVEGLGQFVDPLEPRAAFFGGRVNATKLLMEVNGTSQKIHYVDFTSLYPFVNKNGWYPLGHPEIYTDNLTTNISDYFGLVKCDVLPPRALYHPVLPFKCNKKLMFSLCHACTTTSQQEPCRHTDTERTLTGTWVSLELEKALEKGYKVVKVHEVWHFPRKTQDLFRGYINMFLKKKQEASGWPSWCQSEQDKQKYIKDYQAKEGIVLDYDNIAYNAGSRSVWKNVLNNMWGKMGQRPNRPKTRSISDPKEFFDLLTCGGVEVNNAHLVTDEVVEVFYTMDDSFVEASDRTNVVLAAFTTAQARLKLYDVMDKLGRRVCYYDTDSVVYTSQEGEWEPPLGDYLGELTSELNEGDCIVTFVSAGPKNYAYRTKQGKTVCKVRGITLNFRASEKVNLTTMVDLVKRNDGSVIPVHTPFKIIRDKDNKKILSKPQDKDYRMVYSKRVIGNNFDTEPYGY